MESVRALFKFQTPYKVRHLHQQSILQRVGWGAALKLLWRHWDHVIRPALWFRAALEINGQGSFKETKCADTSVRGAHDADPSLLLGCICGFYCNTMGLMCVSDVFFFAAFVKFCMRWRKFRLFTRYWVEAYLAVPQPLAFLDQMPQALDGWTLGCSANLLWSSIRLERDRQITFFFCLSRLGHSRTPELSLSHSGVVLAY